ncbi:microtubule-associated protein 10-like [Liolophura sinensis]|uniref:microtubule-associated protein 10-like n=1 Tax=Liolophura sinensis TaxID=3198878 RepID=UPI0031591C88
MGEKVDCLFSLELVVDKLYLPHVVCRFPALAFRLLDFPTILISHVEQELGERIKTKISMDADYCVPPQFAELKDKHGNFMVKKGKSCLFKISLEALRAHLTSTPLYVMVVDSYTDVPKLLGNSTVPLDAIIENISKDVASVGNSIPSVHGDKGLFKIYSLMGKEIGYVILGYRMLSIGPALVPHLTDQLISQKDSKPQQLPKFDSRPAETSEIQQQQLPSSQTAWTSTDHLKHNDSIVQTDHEFTTEDKSIHVDMPYSGNEVAVPAQKAVHSISTQTSRRSGMRLVQPEKLTLRDNTNENEDIIFTNISCPPPLFYTGNKNRKTMWINRDIESPDISDSKYEDHNDIISVMDEEISANLPKSYVNKENITPEEIHYEHSNVAVHSRQGKTQNVTENNMFPFLSALLQELSCLPVPQGMPMLPHQLRQNVVPNLSQFNATRKRATDGRTGHKLVQDSVKPASTIRPDHTVSGDHIHNQIAHSPEQKAGHLSHRSCAGDHQSVPKNKSWLRKTPGQAVKKSKLTFGMTNTQRLRLAKANPQMYRALERERGGIQAAQQSRPPQEEFEEGNLSDMSTEIRRHTLDEMAETAGDNAPSSVEDNNQQRQSGEANKSLRVSFNENVAKFSSPNSRRRKKTTQRQYSPDSTRRERKFTPSTQTRTRKATKTLQSELNVNIRASNSNEDNNQVTDTGTDDTPRQTKGTEESAQPVMAMMPDLPQYVPYEPDSTDSEEQESLSHRSGKSIEVRLPSVEPASGEESNASSPERPENGASKMSKLHSFAGFPKDSNYWDSLEAGKWTGDRSDDDEVGNSSYVPSWGMNSDVERQHQSSGLFSSTGDLDSRQFRSTEEQELLDLLSDNAEDSSYHSAQAGVSEAASGKTKSSDKASVSTVLRIPVLNPLLSESSPVPSTRRSVARAELSTAPATDLAEASPSSSKRPTPRPRGKKARELEKKESIHTESVSTYMPSDADNVNTSLASDATYSEDFHNLGSDDDSVSPLPRYIPSTKLGYTIS